MQVSKREFSDSARFLVCWYPGAEWTEAEELAEIARGQWKGEYTAAAFVRAADWLGLPMMADTAGDGGVWLRPRPREKPPFKPLPIAYAPPNFNNGEPFWFSPSNSHQTRKFNDGAGLQLVKAQARR